LVVAGLALVGGMLGRQTGKGVPEQREGAGRCAYDGTKVGPLYRVDAYLREGVPVSFCSIYCATRWFETNKEKVVYFTVVDEVTGQRFDASLAHFVESDVVTVPEVKNRIHAFYVREDALKHAGQFHGRLMENPFGAGFVLPEAARLETLEIGAPRLPDSVPLRLAVFRPIFKENRLDVRLLPLEGEGAAQALLANASVAGLVCDLPTGLVLAKGSPSVRIVKNVLRANPYRPLFALVAARGVSYQDFMAMAGERRVAVPKGLSPEFYSDYYLKALGLKTGTYRVQSVEDITRAWELLNQGSVSAALLRTPYTDMASAGGMIFLADDRNLPWMSVMVLKESIIKEKTEAIRRFIFGLEQSVLALNLKPDEFLALLHEEGGIPREAGKRFPMPIFEGANCPAPDEIEPVLIWLEGKGLMRRDTPFDQLVDPRFLPNPNDVGLAFCCR
jgi:ABC-type nitrate/sulfonate/bicarbonate transport system substrate-binding protein